MHIRVKITRDRSGRVVTMDLEDYLKGVVPSEIKAETCPIEAQKAQAIAARTYAIRKTIDRRSKPYDVDDTAGYQAYGARPRHRNSDAAVEATRGLKPHHHSWAQPSGSLSADAKSCYYCSTSPPAAPGDEPWAVP